MESHHTPGFGIVPFPNGKCLNGYAPRRVFIDDVDIGPASNQNDIAEFVGFDIRSNKLL